MSERIVYLGSFKNKKKNQLINKAIESLKDNRGREFYYLLPNGDLLKKYRQDFINQVENTFEINLFTFDNIVGEILREKDIKIIDNPVKNLLIKRVLEKLISENKLIYYKQVSSTEGFVHSINDIIGEIKRSLVYPEDYLKNCLDRRRFKEIGFIYKEYENMLEKYSLQDREGSYFRSIETLRKDKFLEDLQYIIIDEFYDFRPIELAILKELVKKDLDIYINIPFNMENQPIIMEETIKLLKDLGFTIKYIEEKDNDLFEDLAYKLFSKDKDIFLGREDIVVVNAPSKYLELRRVFEEVKRLNKAGSNLNDIAIVVTNSTYLETLHRVAEEEGIPINIDKTIRLNTIKIIRETLGILKNKISHGSKFNLINRIKFTYFNILDKADREYYESILRAVDFKDINDLQSLLENQKSTNISQDSLKGLNNIISLIKNEIGAISRRDSIENYNNYIINKLNKFHIKEKVFNIYKEFKDEKLLLRDLAAISKLEEILSNLELLPLFTEDISLEEYCILLEELLTEETVVEQKGSIEGLNILDPIASRGILKDFVFVTGLSQESYPTLDDTNYFLNEENIDILRYIGIDSKSYLERLSNEQIKFASIISSCRERLYLTYTRGDGDVSLPSIFLEDLLELIKDRNRIKKNHVDLRYLIKKDINSITNPKDLRRYLLYKFYSDKDFNFNDYNYRGNIDNQVFHLIYQKLQGECQREKTSFNKYKGLLEDESIKLDIKNRIKDKFTITYLESYSTCPYAFMLEKLFKIDPMERDWEDSIPIDRGTIYHETLRSYYEYYLQDIKNHILAREEFRVEETKDYLKEIAYKHALGSNINLESRKGWLILDNIVSRLEEFIIKDLERLSKYQLLPYKFEVEFGEDPEFYIERNNKKIPIKGRIDRIDKFVDKDKYILIDYKSSRSGIKDIDDMRIGLALQLPVYIMSQGENKDILAGAYGIINNGDLDIKLGLVEEISILTRRNKGAVDRREWEELMDNTRENIFNIVDNIARGDFSVNPLDCSKYCPYKYICRYEKALEDEK